MAATPEPLPHWPGIPREGHTKAICIHLPALLVFWAKRRPGSQGVPSAYWRARNSGVPPCGHPRKIYPVGCIRVRAGYSWVTQRQPGYRGTRRLGHLHYTTALFAEAELSDWSIHASNAQPCLLYTSDAADDLLCVDLGGRRIIKKKK